jgi:hypothetical protein
LGGQERLAPLEAAEATATAEVAERA